MPKTLRISNAVTFVAREADFRFAPSAFLSNVPGVLTCGIKSHGKTCWRGVGS